MLDISISQPIEANNAGLFVSPGAGIHPDRVMPNYELIFVRSGTLSIEEESVPFSIPANECLLLKPGKRHRGTMEYSPNLSFYWIHFRSIHGGGKSVPLPRQTCPQRPERLIELFHRFLDDQESDRLLPLQAGCIVTQMLVELTRPSSPSPTRDQSLAGRAERFIASQFHHGIHAGDVAKTVGCHPDYLGRIYRQAFGYTLSEGIHRKQIAEARYRLRESVQNMSEIAQACGFNEPRYFRKLFTRFQGMSPRDYRKLYARCHINTR